MLTVLRQRRFRSRVTCGPALAGHPSLDPGVRIPIAHQVVAEWAFFPHAITHDDSRRDAGGARDEREGRREVLAVAALFEKQEIEQRIGSRGTAKHPRIAIAHEQPSLDGVELFPDSSGASRPL